MQPKHKTDYKSLFTAIFYIVAAAAFIYIVINQFGSLRNSLKVIQSISIKDVIIAFVFILVTFFAAAQSYYFLSFTKLKMARTVVVEFAVNSINRILPSGIGGLAANYVYLRKNNNSRPQSVGVVAINNFLGLLANLGLLAIILIFVKTNPLSINRPSNRDIIIVASLFIVIIGLLFTELRPRIIKAIKNIISELKSYRHRKDSLVFSFISQISISIANILALYFSLQAVNAHLSFSSIMLAYSFAIWLSTVLPTPGGVGAVEVGLTGALVAFGLKFDSALSGVLVFRLISFWIPFFIGGLAFIWARRHKYL